MKKRTIIVYRKDIEFDMAAETNRLFNGRTGDLTQKNQLRYESTVGNIALLSRYLRNHGTKVKAWLKPYLREEIYVTSDIINDPINITDEATLGSYRDMSNDLVFVCYFPDTWDDNQFGLLCDGIYEYILNNSLVSFLRISPAEMGVYIDAADKGYKNIARALTARILPQHRGRFPFDTIK